MSMSMSMFNTNKKLRDELFCVTEERNYFQAKYLEQVSELSALKTDLDQARGEVRRLRERLMSMDQQRHRRSGGCVGGGAVDAAAAAAAVAATSTPRRRRSTATANSATPPNNNHNSKNDDTNNSNLINSPGIDRRLLDESLSDLTASDYFIAGGGEEKKDPDNDDQLLPPYAAVNDGHVNKGLADKDTFDDHDEDDDRSDVCVGGGAEGDDDHSDGAGGGGGGDDDVLSIRQNATKLLQWVDYRITSLSPRNVEGDGEQQGGEGEGLCDDETTSTGEQEVTLKQFCDSVDDEGGAGADDGEENPQQHQRDNEDDEGGDGDVRIRTLYQRYCSKLKEISEASSSSSLSSSFSNGGGGDGSVGGNEANSVGQLVEEAAAILQQMTKEVHAGLSVAKTASSRRRAEEWLERIALYKGQLRLQSM